MTDELVNVRYMVDDVDESIDQAVRLRTRIDAAPAFGEVVRSHLRLLLAERRSRPAGRPMPDGLNPRRACVHTARSRPTHRPLIARIHTRRTRRGSSSS